MQGVHYYNCVLPISFPSSSSTPSRKTFEKWCKYLNVATGIIDLFTTNNLLFLNSQNLYKIFKFVYVFVSDNIHKKHLLFNLITCCGTD